MTTTGQQPWTPADPLTLLEPTQRRRSVLLEVAACVASVAAYLLGWRR